MINSQIVKIASFTKNAGLKNDFTHRSSVKNSLCGDFIKTEFIAHNSKVESMRYETESCILWEASASLFSRKIINVKIKNLEKEIKKIKNFKRGSKYNFPARFKEFNKLVNRRNNSRLNCVILPMEAFLKAFRIK